MSQFAREDHRGAIDFVSDGDVTFESDRDQDGAGDLVFRTGGVERARIKANGSGTGWEDVLGGLVTPFWQPAGTLAATLDLSQLTANTIGLTSGDLRVTGGMVLPAGKTVSNLTVLAGGTSAGTPTHQWFCLIRLSDLTVVAVTIDDTNALWTGNQAKTLPLADAYTPSTNEPCYLGVCVVAGTQPTLSGQTLVASEKAMVPLMVATALTGQTDPVAVGTVITSLTAATSSAFYGYAS